MFQVGAADPASYSGAIFWLLLLALAAADGPARRAGQASPAAALREE